MTLPLDISPYFTGSALSYAATGLPDGLGIAPATGVISGAPTTPGTNPVTVTASNAAGSAQQSFTWTITDTANVPDQVTGLTATPGDGEVSLSWDAPAANGSAITDYVIERRIGGGSFQVVADGTSTATGFTDTGLTNGVLHEYRAAAVNGIGTGAVSAVAGATPAAQGGALSVLAFDAAETGSVSQSISSFTGLATAPGEVIVAVTHRGNANDNQVTGVTLGGQAATLVGRQYVVGQTKQEQSAWRVTATGTTADVTVTTASETSRVGIALWSVGSAGTASVVSTTASGVTALTQGIDAPADGLVLGHATAIGAGVTASWAGLDADHAAEASPNYWHAAASRAFASAVTGHQATVNFGASFNNTVLMLVALAP